MTVTKTKFATTITDPTTRRPELDDKEQRLIDRAIRCLEAKYKVEGAALTSPYAVKDYLKLRLYGLPYEVFSIILLDNQHKPLKYVEVFRGTFNSSSIHPREVVKLALDHNAAAVIFAHNHPSGRAEQSNADVAITKRLVDALDLIDTRVLDHMIVADGEGVSMAERGLI